MRPRIILFDLNQEGHHPQYLECLMRYWTLRQPGGELHLVVSKESAARHPVFGELAETARGATVHQASTPAGFASGEANAFKSERLNRKLAKQYAEALRADHLMFMSLDSVQFSLALDLRFSWPLALSGIYFRPSFHYGELEGQRVARERMTAVAKQLTIRAALRNPHLRTLFSLDPLATPGLMQWARHTDCIYLPEPLWDPPNDVRGSPLTQGLEPTRRRLVLFGSLDKRKGVLLVLDALQGLPDNLQRKLSLILAGRLNDREGPELRRRIHSFEAGSAVQLAFNDDHIPEAEIQPLLRSCDLVLVTYQRHTGSSGLLIRAAAAGVPVLASNHGLVGSQVRSHGLGLTVDSTSADEIRTAIAQWVDHPKAIPFDADAAERFARANTADAFSETIFNRLLVREHQ